MCVPSEPLYPPLSERNYAPFGNLIKKDPLCLRNLIKGYNQRIFQSATVLILRHVEGEIYQHYFGTSGVSKI